MTFVEALALLKNRPAAELTLDELHDLQRFVNENPTVWSVAGGREAVERYLADAQQVHGQHAGAESAVARPTVLPVRRQKGMLIAVFLLAGMALGSYFIVRQLSSNGQPHLTQAPHTSDGSRTSSAMDDASKVEHKSERKVALQNGETTRPSLQASQGVTAAAAEVEPPKWRDWMLKLAPGVQSSQQTQWDLTDAARPRPQMLLATSGGQVELTAEQTIGEPSWLRILLAAVGEGDDGHVEVRVDDQAVARFAVRKPGAYLIPLDHLRGKKVRLSIVHRPGSKGGQIIWDNVSLVSNRSPVAWTVLTPDKVESVGGAKLTVRADRSIVAEGPNTPSEQYFITATMPNLDIRAVRLEAMPDEKLPAGGPGRGEKGEFSISGFAASLSDGDQRRDRLPGRYVRVELDGHDRRLVLSEVEVFAGGKNIALGKATMQSSAAGGSFSELAVDGNSSHKYNRFHPGTVSHTRENIEGEAGAWWEVDLGQEEMIERIVLYNGHPQMPIWSANHRVVVLDMHREVVWQQFNPHPAEPSASYGPFISSKVPVDFRTAIERTSTKLLERPRVVRPDAAPTGGPTTEVCDIYFPLDRVEGDTGKHRIGGKQVTFRVQHDNAATKPGEPPQMAAAAANLGRFRLSVTPDAVSTSPDPPAEIVTLLPEAAKLAGIPAADAKGTSPAPMQPANAKRVEEPLRPLNKLPVGYAWEGWTIDATTGAFAEPRAHWDPTITDTPKLEKRFTASSKSVTLKQSRKIDPANAWLRLLAGQPVESTPAGKMEVRVDGLPIARFETTQIDAAPERLVSLEAFAGRQVNLELAWIPGHENDVVEWTSPTFVANPAAVGYVEWKPIQPEPSARFSTKLKVLPDQSVLAEGENPGGDTYLVRAKMPDMNVTAVRLEVLPHPSLPLGGPGRGDRGSFNMGKFSAELVDPNRSKETKSGRFVRLELVGQGRSLTMAELEVFAGGKNVALKKAATQSTVMFGGTADNAVDGFIGAGNNPKGVGFAHTDGNAPLTWWEVDLGQEYPIDRLVVWNRQWSGNDFTDYKLQILNAQRGVVWEHVEPDFPVPSAAFEFPHQPRPIRFESADVSFDDRTRWRPPVNPEVIIRPPTTEGVLGWRVADVPGRMQVATFTVAPGQNLSGQWVEFQLGQYVPLYYNIGRFRLSVTSAPGPHIARRPLVVEKSLDEK